MYIFLDKQKKIRWPKQIPDNYIFFEKLLLACWTDFEHFKISQLVFGECLQKSSKNVLYAKSSFSKNF